MEHQFLIEGGEYINKILKNYRKLQNLPRRIKNLVVRKLDIDFYSIGIVLLKNKERHFNP